MLSLYFNGSHGCQASGLSVSVVLDIGSAGGMVGVPNQKSTREHGGIIGPVCSCTGLVCYVLLVLSHTPRIRVVQLLLSNRSLQSRFVDAEKAALSLQTTRRLKEEAELQAKLQLAGLARTSSAEARQSPSPRGRKTSGRKTSSRKERQSSLLWGAPRKKCSILRLSNRLSSSSESQAALPLAASPASATRRFSTALKVGDWQLPRPALRLGAKMLALLDI